MGRQPYLGEGGIYLEIMTLMLICGSKPKAPVVIGRNGTTRRSLAGISHWWTRGLDSNRNFSPQAPQRPPLLVRRLPPAYFIFEGMLRRIAGKAWGRVGMVKDGLGWWHFTSRVVSVLRRNPDPHPDLGRLCDGFEPKEGNGTSGQKGHVVIPLELGKSLTEGRTKIQEWSSAQHQRTLAETAYTFTVDWNVWTNNLVGLSNQGPTINKRLRLGKSSFVWLWQQGRTRSHGIWACRSQKGADSSGIAFSVQNLRSWFGTYKIDPICQKIKKSLFQLKKQKKIS